MNRVILVVIVALGCVAAAVFYKDYRLVYSATDRGHQAIRAQQDLRLIAEALSNLAMVKPKVTDWDPCLTNSSASALYTFLSSTNLAVRVLMPREDWNKAKTVIDPWGRSIRTDATMQIQEGSGLVVVRFRIWSTGPNGKDEECGGDDIFRLVDFDLER
jgi:hypothetical protein